MSSLTRLRNCLIKFPQEEDPEESVKDLVDIVMRKMDLDKDGKVSLKDYHETVAAEPLLLEAFGKGLRSQLNFLLQETLTLGFLLCRILSRNPDDRFRMWSSRSVDENICRLHAHVDEEIIKIRQEVTGYNAGSDTIKIEAQSSSRSKLKPPTFDGHARKFSNEVWRHTLERGYKTQLRSKRQNNSETMQEFRADILRLVRLAFQSLPEEIIQELAVEAFVNGIYDSEISTHLRLNHAKDLTQTLARALEYEAAKNATRPSSRVRFMRCVDDCEEPGQAKLIKEMIREEFRNRSHNHQRTSDFGETTKTKKEANLLDLRRKSPYLLSLASYN
ncbi:hypothetical protein HUJ04_000395 [Dendroctonus ponderosae]|nr:hypothetical protein HUJ04_000395 [Dendroctonus ponderosae]